MKVSWRIVGVLQASRCRDLAQTRVETGEPARTCGWKRKVEILMSSDSCDGGQLVVKVRFDVDEYCN